MDKKMNFPKNDQEILDLLEKSPWNHEADEAELDMAWAKVKAVIPAKKPSLSSVIARFVPAALSVAGVAAAAVVILNILPGVFKTRPHAVIASYSSGLQLFRGGRELIPGKETVLRSGDRLVNRSGVPVRVVSPGRLMMQVRPDAALVVDTILQRNQTQARLTLQQGAVDFKVNTLSQGESCQVQTPHVLVAVVGTVFRVHETAGGTVISTLHGEVKVTPSGQAETLAVQAGKQLTVDKDGKAVFADISTAVSEDLRQLDATPDQGLVTLKVTLKGAQATVYVDGQPAGLTPAGVAVVKGEQTDLEVVGTEQVYLRRLGLRPVKDTLWLLENHPQPVTWNKDQEQGTLYSGRGALVQGSRMIILPEGAEGPVAAVIDGSAKTAPLSLGSKTLLMTDQQKMTAVDHAGKTLWSLDVPGVLWYGARLAGNQSMTAVATVDQGISVLGEAGKVLAVLPPEKAGPGYASPALDDAGILYYVGLTGALTAFDVTGKKELWQAPLDETPAHPLMLAVKTVAVYFRTTGLLLAYSTEDGQQVWAAKPALANGQDIQLKAVGSQILSLTSNRVQAFKAADGRKTLDISLTGTLTAWAATDGWLWAALDNRELLQISLKDGAVARKLHLPRPAEGLTITGNRLLVSCGGRAEVISW